MRSPFDFDISAASDKKRRRGRSRAQSGAFEHSTRVCEKPGCERKGKYRAPKSPDSVNEYVWFCLQHVREYNAKWNFFENYDREEIEKQIAADRIGERPTKPMNSEEAKAWARMGFDDPFQVLRDKATQRRDGQRIALKLSASERRAVDILGAAPDAPKSELRRIYKSLIKDLHPDRNKGSRADEDRLNEVVWAWDQIKDSRNFS